MTTNSRCEFPQPRTPDQLAQWQTRDFARCLAHRRVYIGGNSVARSWAFALARLLSAAERRGADATPNATAERLAEKVACGGGDFDAARSLLSCQFSVGEGTTIDFGMVQRVLEPDLEGVLNSSHFDLVVVVLGSGSDDIWNPARVGKWRQTQQREAPLLAKSLANVGQQNKAPLLYWRTLTPNCVPHGEGVRAGNRHMNESIVREYNALLQAASFGLVSALCHNAHVHVPLRVLDTWSWVSGRCDEYDDHVHHERLAEAHVRSLVIDACPHLAHSYSTDRVYR